MRKVASLAMVMIAVSAVTVACGQQRASSGSAGAAAPAGSSPVAGAGRPGGCRASGPPAAGPTITVTSSDNGRSFCVKPGTGVMVILRGSPDRRWASIHASSGALVPRANGRLMLQAGVTGAYFVAVHPGTAVITSARPACAAKPGTMHCTVELAFRATVMVAR